MVQPSINMAENTHTDSAKNNKTLWDNLEENVRNNVINILKNNGLENPEILATSNQEAGNHFMSRLYKITAKSKEEPKKEIKLILKQMPEDDELKNIVRVEELFDREILMYSKVLVTFEELQKNLAEEYKFRYAKCYIASTEDKMILLEDLSSDGYQVLSEKGHEMNDDQVCLVLKNLAHFHALSFAMKELESDKFSDLADSLTDYSYFDPFTSYINTVGELTLNLIEDPAKRTRVEPHAINLFEKYLRDRKYERADPYNVVCHSDCWNNNLLFKYEVCMSIEKYISKLHYSIKLLFVTFPFQSYILV